MALDEALAAAEERRTFCQTVPSMNAYQPLATSALEVCVSATQVCLLYFSRATIATDRRQHTGKNTSLLAVHAVKRTAALIEAGVDIPMSPERRESLERFQRWSLCE
jgi:CMP-2-keto-3-deoxyoctulosonic acid synthetase